MNSRRKISESNELLDKARTLFQTGEESKFEKLREVLSDSKYVDEKFIIFTEHRDTAEFLVRRFESLGFTGPCHHDPRWTTVS